MADKWLAVKGNGGGLLWIYMKMIELYSRKLML